MHRVGGFHSNSRSRNSPPGNGESGEWRVVALAERQYGVVSRAQLAALGFSGWRVDHRVGCGRLHVVHRGVYAVGHRGLSRCGRWMAAVLACPPDALLSHQSAAALWGILDDRGGRVHVSAARSHVSRAGMVIHRPRSLHEEDRAVRSSIPVTSVARTLLDLAATSGARSLARAVDEADRLGHLDLEEASGCCRRGRGRRGTRALRELLADHDSPPPTRSELERRFLDLCHRAALPAPAVNVHLNGFEVDAHWPEQRLIVELDGFEFHRTRAAFERDRSRDVAVQAAGYRVLRFTHRRLQREPAAVAAALRPLLYD